MNNKPKKIAVLGAGVWGQTLASLAKKNDHQVRLWSRQSSHDLGSVIDDIDLIISAVSMQGVRPIIEQLKMINLPPQLIIITATKGLDTLTTHTPAQLWQEAFPLSPIVVLSGPNLSKEIQQGLPATTVVSSKNITAAETVQMVFSSECFRVYINSDPLGTELGGTLKNIMAIAAGVCDGLQLGTNAKAGLLTRALPEMIRVGINLGAQAETFFGLSGLGDLLATCNSHLSRNYQLGYQLAQNKSLEKILSELEGTVEGINTTQVLMKIAQAKGINVPISAQVYRLIQGEITPQQAVKALMERDLKSEFGDLKLIR